MNLSLYLLLAPASDAGQAPANDQQEEHQAKHEFVPVYDPLPRTRVGSTYRVQASRKTVLTPEGRGTTAQSIRLGMSVIANAVGFVVVTTAALLLLRVAEISLT